MYLIVSNSLDGIVAR